MPWQNRVGEESKQSSLTWSALTRVWDLQMCIYIHKAHTAGRIIWNSFTFCPHRLNFFLSFFLCSVYIFRNIFSHAFWWLIVAMCLYVCVCTDDTQWGGKKGSSTAHCMMIKKVSYQTSIVMVYWIPFACSNFANGLLWKSFHIPSCSNF